MKWNSMKSLLLCVPPSKEWVNFFVWNVVTWLNGWNGNVCINTFIWRERKRYFASSKIRWTFVKCHHIISQIPITLIYIPKICLNFGYCIHIFAYENQYLAMCAVMLVLWIFCCRTPNSNRIPKNVVWSAEPVITITYICIRTVNGIDSIHGTKASYTKSVKKDENIYNI